MRERIPCEFFLVRYVPDVVKGEFVNVGVVLREEGGGGRAQVRFTREWSRVRCLDGDADVEMLEALESELARRLAEVEAGVRPLLEVLTESLSNSIQVTEARACLAESVPAEMEQLMRMYVDPLKVKKERAVGGRAGVAAAMRREFERAGVWGLMRKRVPAAMYTRAGDPMKIDCAYRPNGVIRMFQAVSLSGDVEAAKVLAYSAPALRDGVQRVEAAKLEMTAVVEPLASVGGDAEESYRFGVEAMERADIRVMTMNDLPRIAATARMELRV